MITFITGTPGAGKTAYVVAHIIEKAVEEGRPVFQMGIPDLALAHLPTPPIAEWTHLRESDEEPGLMLPYFSFPENSLIVLDECQRVYRLRTNGSKVPEHVAAFETHRHTGVDFVLMTQNPQLVDAHVRKLVGRHIHLRDVGLYGRWLYEWPECTDVSQFRTAPVKKRYKLPKHAFSLYKSASLHLKQTRTVPPVLYVLGFALISVLALSWQVFGTVSAKVKGETKPSSVMIPPGNDAKASSVVPDIKTPAALLAELVPLVDDRPETAPIYSELRVAKDMPQIVGCVQTDDSCLCFTQQGTRAYQSAAFCAAWMTGGRPFNPYREPPDMAKNDPPMPPPPKQQQQVLGVPGSPLWLLKDPVLPPKDNTAAAPLSPPSSSM